MPEEGRGDWIKKTKGLAKNIYAYFMYVDNSLVKAKGVGGKGGQRWAKVGGRHLK